jgi:pimeloyl-ACP methyl ester carboxylesterase
MHLKSTIHQQSSVISRRPARPFVPAVRLIRQSACLAMAGMGLLLLASGCRAPIGADQEAPKEVFQQVHGNALVNDRTSAETRAILHRFDQDDQFNENPDATLRLLHQKAEQSGDRSILYALSELNYLEGERVRRIVKPWEPRDARDYYLASAVYAWFFIFNNVTNQTPMAYDDRFRAACNFYNTGLSWALTGWRATNAVAILQSGTRHLPMGEIDIQFSQPGFAAPLNQFSKFLLADQFLVRGMSVRNIQPGLGAPLIAVAKSTAEANMSRCTPATAFLRIEGGLADLGRNPCKASLELYSPFASKTTQVESHTVPFETDTTAPLAYSLNQAFLWSLGNVQFLSGVEQIPTGIYSTRPYQPGLVPVVFVHGTFSSPVWWAEMANTLFADPVLGERCQFWFFIYNSGNPMVYSASRLREALTAKIKELDPDGRDTALQQMVVIGHSQGGLLTKLTATDTGDRIWHTLNTNKLETLKLTQAQQDLVRKYLFYQPLPFVSDVVFISTPHRGSYLASNLARNLARKLVTLPKNLLDQGREIIGLKEKLGLPKDVEGLPTSLDSMSPNNPVLLALADIPTAPGVKAHSIISVEGDGDYHQGKDGLVAYSSAHVDYATSEFIVRSFHSCLSNPATIEEVRRILREHIADLPPAIFAPPTSAPPASSP